MERPDYHLFDALLLKRDTLSIDLANHFNIYHAYDTDFCPTFAPSNNNPCPIVHLQ